MTNDSRWIVVTENHYWGAAESLREALHNAHLREDDKLSAFTGCYSQSQLEVARSEWLEWGKDEHEEARDYPVSTNFVMAYFNEADWEDWEVSPISGAMSFQGYKGEGDPQQAFDDLLIYATFKDGELIPRKRPQEDAA